MRISRSNSLLYLNAQAGAVLAVIFGINLKTTEPIPAYISRADCLLFRNEYRSRNVQYIIFYNKISLDLHNFARLSVYYP